MCSYTQCFCIDLFGEETKLKQLLCVVHIKLPVVEIQNIDRSGAWESFPREVLLWKCRLYH